MRKRRRELYPLAMPRNSSQASAMCGIFILPSYRGAPNTFEFKSGQLQNLKHLGVRCTVFFTSQQFHLFGVERSASLPNFLLVLILDNFLAFVCLWDRALVHDTASFACFALLRFSPLTPGSLLPAW